MVRVTASEYEVTSEVNSDSIDRKGIGFEF